MMMQKILPFAMYFKTISFGLFDVVHLVDLYMAIDIDKQLGTEEWL